MKESAKNINVRASRNAASLLAELLKPYHSGWVALSHDEREVVAAAETLHETRKRAANIHARDPIFVKVIPPEYGYLPSVS